ncbi:S41 family peptidase [Flavicella sediminum]|uniref:S41 family peptidase n=1 Tax=Flavicella sediminum TaxID=2585141 RepID=UPI001122DF61|nr:S41 family peptidase [Flavicella sediminum]
MLNNKNNLPLLLGIAVAFGIALGSFFNFENGVSNYFVSNQTDSKLGKLLQFIEQDYVDEVNTDALLDDVIKGIVDKLDPHSVYFPKEDFLASHENMQGNFEGIGVQFFMNNDSLVVTKVIKGGPSEKAGVLAGDRILLANKDTLYNKNLQSRDIVKILKGPADTKVDLEIFRRQTQEILHIPIVRNKVDILSVEVAYMLTDSLGYLKLDRFAMTSYDEFKHNLGDLQQQGAKNLVLDLRQNGGGFIHVANAIIDEFLKEGKLIVFTENNKGRIEESFATAKGSFQEGNVYVLIDEGSASASEILAGALQDNDKGVIVGRRSFGKGLVQQERDLGDGSAVRLTIARYFTPTGRSIQKPYNLDDNYSYSLDHQNRILSGELLSKDSIKVVDSLKYTTPKGKVVYGGGGIIPDVFVAIDTTAYLENFYFNSLNNFTFEYADKHRKKMEALSFEDFNASFDANDEVLKEYLKYIKLDKPVPAEKKKLVKHYLKALVARQAYDEVAFYKINQKQDKMIEKVLELEKQ